ncbi:hypothetical protein BDN72DRAFT_900445 [Pluteus cervinus]|uniref:Uncharacterized protein n=1 Tax=Pluteus cervinus TaxID=181527 RepID=A0ACD3AJX9_9AGAR|nr:hypothetical protein BDN72DRAFT_900445 [Pluteus cervinus]
MSDPIFPPELEQQIFAYAIQNQIEDMLNLFLVAKRVRDWLLPVAFETVVLDPHRQIPRPFDNLSLYERYGLYTHHILLNKPTTTTATPSRPFQRLHPVLIECLGHCPNVINLALWWPLPRIRLMSLTIFSNLTHLSMITQDLHAYIRGFALLSSFNDYDLVRSQSTDRPSKLHVPVLFPNVIHLSTPRTEWHPSIG